MQPKGSSTSKNEDNTTSLAERAVPRWFCGAQCRRFLRSVVIVRWPSVANPFHHFPPIQKQEHVVSPRSIKTPAVLLLKQIGTPAKMGTCCLSKLQHPPVAEETIIERIERYRI